MSFCGFTRIISSPKKLFHIALFRFFFSDISSSNGLFAFRVHLLGQIQTSVFEKNLVLRKYTQLCNVVIFGRQSPCHPICKTSGMFVPIWSPVSTNGKDKGMTTEVFTGRAISTLLLQNHLPSLFPVFYEDIRKECRW